MGLYRRALCRGLLLLVVLFAGCSPAEEHVRSLTILHTNDLHARFLPDTEGRGGFAQLASAIRLEKAKSEGVLVLNGGDLVQGTPASSIYEGIPCDEVVSAMGFDVDTIGNHEFDYGWPKILEFIDTAAFPIVSANVVNGEERLLAGQACVVREVNGLRVAVIGALTATLPNLTKEHQRGPWRVLPVAETVRRHARRLRDQTDLIIVLSHLVEEEEEDLLEEVPEINLVVSGHSHAGQREVREVDGRLCVKVRAYGRELGRLDLKVDAPNKRVVWHRWRRIPINAAAYPPDENVAALIEKWEAKVATVVDVPIGVAKRAVERRELRNTIEAAMLEAVAADLAYMNSGGIRDGLPEGEILVRHVWNVLPFGNAIVYGRIKGSRLPAQVSTGRQVDPDRDYVLVTNDFIADQWRQQGIELPGQGPLVREALIDWIKARRVIE